MIRAIFLSFCLVFHDMKGCVKGGNPQLPSNTSLELGLCNSDLKKEESGEIAPPGRILQLWTGPGAERGQYPWLRPPEQSRTSAVLIWEGERASHLECHGLAILLCFTRLSLVNISLPSVCSEDSFQRLFLEGNMPSSFGILVPWSGIKPRILAMVIWGSTASSGNSLQRL